MGEANAESESLMRSNVLRVFSGANVVERAQAIAELYATDAVFYEVDVEAKGHAEIAAAVEALRARLPPEFVFTPEGVAANHHGLGRLRWRVAPPDGPAAVTGMDVVRVAGGRIVELHVFLDPPAESAV